MTLPDPLVEEVAELARTVRLDDAEAVLVEWWTSLDHGELVASEADLRLLVEQHFLPRRRRRIFDSLAAQMASPSQASHAEEPVDPEAQNTSEAVSAVTVPTGDILAGAANAGQVDPSLVGRTSNQTLADVSELNRTANPQAAEELFRAWLSDAPEDDLTVLEPEVRTVLNRFLRKRHNALTIAYNQRLARVQAASRVRLSVARSEVAPAELAPEAVAEPSGPAAGSPDEEFRNYTLKRLDERLVELSERHIFQWNTHYRDMVSEFFDPMMEFLDPDPIGSAMSSPVAEMVSERFRRHAREIFEKGWVHIADRNGVSAAQAKAESGIQSFLDLPLEVYSSKLAALQDGVSARSLRMIASAMLSGILRGAATAKLGDHVGTMLPRIHRVWGRALPFVTASDLRLFLMDLHEGPMHVGISTSLLPFAQAIDRLVEEDQDRAPLPRISDYTFQQRRITVSLQPPSLDTSSGRWEIQICLDESYVDRSTLDSAHNEAVVALLAPLAADLRAYADSWEPVRAIAVPTIGIGNGIDPAARLREILRSKLSRKNAISARRPIDFNYAELFPLTDPKFAAYRHVERSSVRRLLQRFDRRNGVRLWCSVRRSGKTTASASDLGTTSESAVVISETCDHTGRHSGTNVVYTAIRMALAEGKNIPNDFFRRTLSEAMTDSRDAQRITFVLDEYETLFGNLRGSISRDPHVRYTVVQPLLDQMVEFADQNLIIFLGQQPDAHYMLMSQNQLSAYVEQDPFPLFSHDPDSYRGEFQELLQRVLTNFVNYDHSFANAVYDETGGHPFLTVNVLVALFAWLISTKRPRSLLDDGLTGAIFDEFVAVGMTRKEILSHKAFELFRKVARDALGEKGRREDPWLYSIYAAVRRASLDGGADFAIPQDEFVDMIARLGVALHDEPEVVLGTAVQANFLRIEGDVVRPRIRALSRVAATVTAG